MKIFVIFVKTGREKAVFRELKKRGFKPILPLKQEFRRVGEKWEIDEKIIFTNYVFLKCELIENIHSEIRKIPDIQRILGAEDDDCVPFLKKHEQSYIEWLANGGKSIKPSEILIKPDGQKVGVSGFLKKYSDFEYNPTRREVLLNVEIGGFSHKIALPAVEKGEYEQEKNS